MQPASIVKGEGPESNLECFRPMEKGMLHHGAGFLSNSTNAALGHPVLKFSADAGKVNVLPLIIDILHECFVLEDTVVSMGRKNGDAARFRRAFEYVLEDNGGRTTKRDLMVAFNQTASMVTEDGAAAVLMAENFATTSCREATTNRRLVLVDGDFLTRSKMIPFKNVFLGLEVALFRTSDPSQ